MCSSLKRTIENLHNPVAEAEEGGMFAMEPGINIQDRASSRTGSLFIKLGLNDDRCRFVFLVKVVSEDLQKMNLLGELGWNFVQRVTLRLSPLPPVRSPSTTRHERVITQERSNCLNTPSGFLVVDV